MRKKLNKNMKLKEFLTETGYSKSSFFDKINDIFGEKGAYKIPLNSFRKGGKDFNEEDYCQGEKDFFFKKEWADLAVVLLRLFKANPMYNKNASYKKLTLESLSKYNDYCLEEIENLSDEHKKEIKVHPVYGAMLMEKIMLERVQKQVYILFKYIQNCPIEQRTTVWQKLDMNISQLLLDSFITGEDTKVKIKRKAGEFEKFFIGDFEHNFIDLFIAELLEKELDEDYKNEKKKFREGYVDKSNSKYSIPLDEYIAQREEEAKNIANSTPTFKVILDHYLKANCNNLSKEQKQTLLDFSEQIEMYQSEYDTNVFDCKEAIEQTFSAVNAEIIRRK